MGRVLLLSLLLSLPLVNPSPFALHIGVFVLMYGALGAAWNLVGGYLGRVSFGHAAFFGVGAYTSLLALERFGITPLLGIPFGAFLAGGLAFLVGAPTLRLRGHYFALATIGLSEVVRILFVNWSWAGGAVGLEAPLTPSWLTLTFRQKEVYFYLSIALALLTAWIAKRLVETRSGYYWRAIRGDEEAARALGVPVERYKRLAFVVSAALTALWGGFFAHYVGFIDPESVFSLAISVQMVLVSVLGGVGTLAGPWIGAALLVPLAELTRAGLGGGGRGVDLLIYGLVILGLSLFQPGGLMALTMRRRRAA
ncbi:branched-chain amino acid ABC transporter permease [Thermus islandicus]|uniref:branched-chain amino acid ABC transporter permease n=1 Tax=Thermus islandicus TaxID=540988 RepID=UPI0003B4AF3E|nr:branched-chain amino acid ABC transporter permease [Thermus islandicus]